MLNPSATWTTESPDSDPASLSRDGQTGKSVADWQRRGRSRLWWPVASGYSSYVIDRGMRLTEFLADWSPRRVDFDLHTESRLDITAQVTSSGGRESAAARAATSISAETMAGATQSPHGDTASRRLMERSATTARHDDVHLLKRHWQLHPDYDVASSSALDITSGMT